MTNICGLGLEHGISSSCTCCIECKMIRAAVERWRLETAITDDMWFVAVLKHSSAWYCRLVDTDFYTLMPCAENEK